jgi:hypothetical protein
MNRANFFIALSILASQSFATSVDLNGGGESLWHFRDDVTTTNGDPTGGWATTVLGTGSGASVKDASIAGQGDAFNYAVMYWVNDNQVGGILSNPTASSAVYSPVVIDGLSVQLKYELLGSNATLRALLTLQNPTDADISVPVVYENNYGSDGSTSVSGTSSGDTVFDPSDRWLVTDDGTITAGDPANTTVLFGPDSPAVTPSSVSQTVFTYWGDQGTQATYNITVPAGETKALMMFQQLNTTSSDALMAASEFDSTPHSGSELLTDLTEEDLSNVVNWSFGSNAPPVADAGGPYVVGVDLPVRVSGAASDPDGDAVSCKWSAEAGYFDYPTLEDPSYYAYNEPGIYTLTFTATDPAGLSDTALTQVVVYDPYGSFVSGGGWVDSEAGKASFNFVSRYKKGDSVPTGHTDFTLSAADLSFHADNNDWLVVTPTDSSAQYEGSGTINGAGNYRFRLWATDGEPDTLRIRIWEEDGNGGETVLYDNGDEQPIRGGNIVVHSVK